MQKVPELVVHECMSQGKGTKRTKEKKKVKGWSTEEMKGKPSSSLEEDRRNEKMEMNESGRDGSMLEEFG